MLRIVSSPEGGGMEICVNKKQVFEGKAAEKEHSMEDQEKTYKAMKATGAMNLALGIITIVTGITTGVLLIAGGARLLVRKNKIMF